MNPALPFAVANHPVPEAFGTSGEHAKLELRSHGIVNPRPGEIVPNRAHVDAILAFGRTLRTVHGVRERAWLNLRLVELGDAALDRGGTLVAATHALHRLQLDVQPHIAGS